MGAGHYDESTYRSYSSTHRLRSAHTNDIFRQNTERQIHQSLDPKGVEIREARDLPEHPASTPLICALDVSGSMGILAEQLAREGCETLARSVYERKPVTDPQVMFMGIDDIEMDPYPLQVSQFESDIRILEQLRRLYLEGGGGGNQYESYAMAWYFAAQHTAIDSWERRQKKGYLFTVGDELPTPRLRVSDMERVLGYRPEIHDVRQILERCQEKWHVFHLMVEGGSNYRANVPRAWRELIGNRAIPLPDHKRMAEVIVSLIQINEGQDRNAVVQSWGSGDIVDILSHATESFSPGRTLEV